MGDGTKENPYTRTDVLRQIKKHGGSEELDLSGKVFEDGINLSGLYLHGIIMNKSILHGANFNGSNLSEAKLRGAHLQRTKFNKYTDKNFTNLTNADLSGADLCDAELIGAFLNNTNFRNANLMKANLSIEGRREPDLHFTDFRGANLFFANLKGRTFNFTKLEGAYINWADILDSALGDADWGNYVIGDEKKNNFYAAKHRYRHLKNWYTNHGYQDIAAKFYYREKEADRKGFKLFSKSWNHRIALQFSYWVFGHGEGWKRLLFGWVAGVIVGLAAAYYFWGSFTPPSSFWDTLYYSATSFSALGYGQWASQPTGWAKGMGAAEAIIGVFMMALLLVTFVRKMTR